MTQLEFCFKTELNFTAPVTDHVFTLRCLPMPDQAQRLDAWQLWLDPAAEYGIQKDGFGGLTVCGSYAAEHQRFVYSARGLASVDLSRPRQDPVNPVFHCFTPLTQPDEAVRALWSGLPLAGLAPHAQAQLLNRAAFDALRYTPGATTNATTAAQALALGQGVCQDYAHLLLALARLSGFAARYCMGLIPGEGATHAWVELALPEGWTSWDPTQGCEAGEDHLRFGAGRDAADCPAERGVFRGTAGQSMQVDMQLRLRA